MKSRHQVNAEEVASLRERERRLRAIFDQSLQFMGLMTPEGILIEANRTALEFYGLSESDVLNRPFWEAPWWTHSPEQQEGLREAIRKAATGEFVRIEVFHPAPDGVVHYVDLSIKPVKDEAGNVYLLVPEGRDETERRQAEEEVRRLNARLESRLVALTQPLGDIANLRFEDIFDVEEIQRIQDAFAEATGVASIITDTEGRPITRPSNFCHLCEHIIRKTEKGLANCYHSDAVLGRMNPDGPIMQPCLSGGLWDGGTSICVGERHIANWLIGQVLDTPVDDEKMLAYAREIGADEDEFRSALADVTRMPRAQFAQVCNALFLIAGQLSRQAIQNVQQSRFTTEARTAQAALKESEARYRLLAENTLDLIWLVGTDLAYSYVNQAATDVVGYAPEELVGRNALELHPPEEHERIAGIIADEVEKGPKHTGRTFEVRMLRKDGREFTAEITGKVIFDEEGRAVAYQGITRDVTARNETETALRESEARYRVLVQNAPEAIVTLDVDAGKFVDANENAKRLYGLEYEEIFELSPADLSPPRQPDGRDSAEAAATYVQEALEGGVPIFEWTHRNVREGRNVPCEVRLVRLPSTKNRLVRGSVIDISERKRAERERLDLERQVQHAQKLESLGVLAGGIAHDFNNILVSILGYADLALLDLSPHSPAIAHIKEVEKGARRAADLATQMLAYSGKGRFELKSIDLSEFVKEMAHLLEVSTSKRAILRYTLAASLPPMQGDATQIRQVIMNLITNASEAIGEEDGVIAVTTGVMACDSGYLKDLRVDEDLPEGTYVYLEVADTGSGMDKATREKIFEPFFTTKFTGRGLGLSAVLGIMRGHKGAIKVYSEPAKGTTFKVLFPAVAGAAERSMPMDGEGAEEDDWAGAGMILLVDDEENVRVLGEHMLRRIGFEPVTATDGHDALRVLREHTDDIVCVILDLTMPHMDGEECFRELRNVKADIPVIMSSGYNEQDVTQRFVGKGLAGFIQKPYQLAALKAKIREVLEGGSAAGEC